MDNFIGNNHAVNILKRAIEQDRLPYAMIFAGPDGVGKCTLALMMAQALNCLTPQNGAVACKQCSACRRIGAYFASRHKECVKGADESCGVCPVCQGRNRLHPDIRIIEPDKKTIISIEQIGNVIAETAFQPLEARYRVVILDPADQMRREAQNSLLKTLEEPSSRTILILIATNPYLLLETIRSRARILPFGEIPSDQIAQYLTQNEGIPASDALLVAALSGGSLGAAMEPDTAECRKIRESALEFVDLLLSRGSFARASALAESVTKEKNKSFFEVWMKSVSAILRDIYYSGIAPERIAQSDLFSKLHAIRQKTQHSHLTRAIEAMRKLHTDMHYNVNRRLALEALFLKSTQEK